MAELDEPLEMETRRSNPISVELGTTVTKLLLKAGDSLVVTVPGKLSSAAEHRIRRVVRDFATAAGIPEVPVLVLDDGISLAVVGRDPESAPEVRPLPRRWTDIVREALGQAR